jgi:ubiquinone/menaquinone biosynthesis C-methylase UbiE
VRDEYAQIAASYETRWRRYVETTARRTLEWMQPPPGSRLLDLGCGTGLLLRASAARAPGVRHTGADLSLPMLRVARARGTPAGLAAADAAALPFADGAFDTAVSVSSLHLWDDPVAALRDLRRVLAPGGALVLTDWCRDALACRLADRWLDWTGRAAYRRVYTAGEAASLLRASGFTVRRSARFRVGAFWRLMIFEAGA